MARVPSQAATGAAPRIEMIASDALRGFDGNPRTHSEDQILAIARSITEFGFTVPVLIDADNVLIAGHGRLAAAQRVGISKIPAIRLSHLSPAQRRAYVIADNRLTEAGGWDESKLAKELQSLAEAGFDLTLTGFSASEANDLLMALGPEPGLTDPDEVPDLPERPVSKGGDLWLLGRHRVLCGDSTDLRSIQALADARPIDLCWTDPPYNVAYTGKTANALTIANDAMSETEFAAFLERAFRSAGEVMRAGASIYVAHAETYGVAFRSSFAAAGFKLSSCLMWVKDVMVLGRSDYQWRHEAILYGWKPGASHRWFGGRKQTTVLESSDRDPFVQLEDGRWMLSIGGRVLLLSGDAQLLEIETSTLHHPRPKRSTVHPTMKPVELIERMLTNSARRGDAVLDIFGGSGSTLIAAHRLGMDAHLIELDPRYVDVIVRRWQAFSGEVATRASDGKSFSDLDVK